MYSNRLADAIKRILHLREVERTGPWVRVQVHIYLGIYTLWLPYEAVYL